ncbi:MAG: LysE family transporter [Pseudomonadota bacterium]
MLAFLLTVLLLLGTPGPGVLALAGVGAAFGKRSGLGFFAGLLLGHNLISLAVVGGLAAAFLTIPALATGFAVLSALYLLWLALKIGSAGSKFEFAQQSSAPRFLDGILLQAVNPKAYAVSLAVFANFNLDYGSPAVEIVFKFIAFNAVWIVSHGTWLALGVWLKQLGFNARMQSRINIALALALVIAVLLIVFANGFWLSSSTI